MTTSSFGAKGPVLEYLGEFKAMIDACGQVSYYWNMRRFIAAEVNRAKVVASAYQHDLRYYEDQFNEWREKARRSFDVLSIYAEKFGYRMPPQRDVLNALAIHKGRREAYKDYLKVCLRNETTLSVEELEAKYQLRLRKRLERNA